MKTAFQLFALAIIIILQACTSDDSASVKSRIKTIHLASKGEIAVAPNEASISIYLQCVDKNIKVSKDCLIKKSSELNSLLASYHIKKEDILTTNISQSKTHKWENNSYVFEGYESSVSTIVTFKDLKTLETLYPELLANENISLGGLTYTHSNMDSLSNLAYANALKKANATAEVLLVEMSKSKKEIIRIGNVALPENNNEFALENKLEEDSYKAKGNVQKETININNGKMYVVRNIFVEYKIN